MDALRGLFLKLDKNKDGFISVAELHNEMKKTGILAVDEKAQSVISQFDQDDDGRLSYEEFLSYMINSEKKWKIHFQDLDRDKCGEIGEDEIIHLFKELGVVISKPSAKRIIQMMDKDNSMTVDWEEFLHHVILNPAENLGELVSSWKHSLVFDVGESRAMPLEFPEEGPDSGMWRRFVLAAGLADAVSRTVTAPIDRLKTQLQVYGSKAFSEGFRSLKEGGVRAMWQGNAVNVLKGTPQSTLQCLIYSQMKVSTLSLGGQESLSVQQRFGLGCFSGAVAHAVFYPLEVLKVHLNLQQASTYSGVLGGARLFFRNGSMASFYRGFKPSIMCMIPYAGVECAVHQSIISWAKSDPVYSSDYKIFFFSFVAFACGQVTSYALAVIRTQRQAQAFSLHSSTSSVLQGLIGIYERHGIRGYYNGMGASFVRAVPCALLNFTLTTKFEMLLSTL